MRLAKKALTIAIPRKVYLLLTLFIIISFAGITGLSLVRDASSLKPLLDAKIETARSSLLQKINSPQRPNRSFRNLGALFSQTLTQVPEFTYLAIIDGNQKLRVEAGSRPPGLVNLDLRRATQEISNLTVHTAKIEALAEHGDLRILIGVDGNILHHRLLRSLPALLTALMVIVGIGFVIFRGLLDVQVFSSLRAVQALMDRIGAGDFRAGLSPVPGKFLTEMTDMLNSFVSQVNGHFVIMGILAKDIEAEPGPGNQQTRKRLSAHIAQLLNRFHFAEGDSIPALSAASPTAIRLPLLLITFAETLSYVFLPEHIAGIHTLQSELATNLFIATPITTTIAATLIGWAISSYWSNRTSLKSVLVVSAIMSSLGFAGAAYSASYESLMIWRALSGLALGNVFGSCQNYVSRFASEENFAESQNVFFLPLLAGGLLGFTLGGLFADVMELSEIFAVSASLALLMALLTISTLHNIPEFQIRQEPTEAPGLFPNLLTNLRFILFIALGVLPSRIVLSGFLLFLAPVYLFNLEIGALPTGWILASAVLFIILLTPVMSRLADKYGLIILAIFAGFIIFGAVAMAMTQWQNALTVISVTFAIGFGHALVLAPSLSALPRLCEQEFSVGGPAPVLKVYRLTEGFGVMAGPVIAAILADRFGYAQTIFYLGCAILISAILFGLAFVILRLQPEDAGQPPAG